MVKNNFEAITYQLLSNIIVNLTFLELTMMMYN